MDMNLVKATPATKGQEIRHRFEEGRNRRREAEIRTGKEALAKALENTLVLLRHKGDCGCGMMLTERDKNPKADTYRCPRCGKSGPLSPEAADLTHAHQEVKPCVGLPGVNARPPQFI